MGADSPIQHLYIHVPFCMRKCAYCDFTSVEIGERTPRIAEYAEGVLAQLDSARTSAPIGPLKTLYLGGGTPTAIGDALPDLIDSIVSRVGLGPDAEVTCEANPDAFDQALSRELVRVGVTRISVGVQSFDDEVLKVLGRIHDAARARTAVEVAIASGVDVSMDLICGVPGQSRESWTRTLNEAVSLGVGHMSVYPLSIEPRTPLHASLEAGVFKAPDPDEAAWMMVEASRLLEAAGLERYEIANYAVPGKRSVHNSAYWLGREYLGLGPSAHSMAAAVRGAGISKSEVGEGAARCRWSWTSDVAMWLEEPLCSPEQVEYMSEREAMVEDVMLGMRLSGVTAEKAEEIGVTKVLDDLFAVGLVKSSGEGWCLTEKGWLLGNEVFAAIWDAR